jgi:2-polyprenyl-3-methyl-5-hydroxy-6-metoxy-1,4-benzoquinol methylase
MLETVPATDLIAAYRRRLGLDIGKELAGIATLLFVRCDECELLSFWPLAAGSSQFYDRLQAFAWYYAEEKNEYGFARRFLTPKDTGLEVGCGKGAFGASLQVARYVGLEFSARARQRGVDAGLEVLGESVEVHAAGRAPQYDVVCAFQVLEHVPAVREFLDACVACLKPGGRLILSVPSADSFAREVPNFLLDMPPHHLTRWPDAALQALSRLLPLECIELWHEPLQRVHRDLQAATRVHRWLRQSIRRPARAWDEGSAARLMWLASGALGWLLARIPTAGAPPGGISVTAVYRKSG